MWLTASDATLRSPSMVLRRLPQNQRVRRLRVEVVNQCARAWAKGIGRGALQGPWWITMLEVLDNLGHDQMRVTALPDGTTHCEELVVADDEEPVAGGRPPDKIRSYRALGDADIVAVSKLLGMDSVDALYELRGEIASTDGAAAGANVAHHAQSFFESILGGSSASGATPWRSACPRAAGGCCVLCDAAPEHQFTIADFSWLPPQPDGVINAPVVQIQRGGKTIDLKGDYLRMSGQADILFPTNFAHLGTLVQAASHASGSPSATAATQVVDLSSADFMREWHDLTTTQSQGTFNPLVDDFTNTRFLLTGAAQ